MACTSIPGLARTITGAILLGMVITSAPALASKVYYDKPDKYVKAAHAVAVVRFVKSQRERRGCDLTVTLFYMGVRSIKGPFPKNRLLRFTLQHYVYGKGCPSVHYRLPPAGGGRDQSIATLQRFGNEWVITSTYAITELRRIERLLKK